MIFFFNKIIDNVKTNFYNMTNFKKRKETKVMLFRFFYYFPLPYAMQYLICIGYFVNYSFFKSYLQHFLVLLNSVHF